MTEQVRVQILLRLLECISGNLEVVWIAQKLTCYKSTSWRAERAFFARETAYFAATKDFFEKSVFSIYLEGNRRWVPLNGKMFQFCDSSIILAVCV